MEKEKWVVCSAWPYVNFIPHLGTLIGSMLSGDVFARFLRHLGNDVIYVSGSDVHGARMEFEALIEGITPEELVERNHKIIVDHLKKFRISFDNYTKTSSQHHKRFIQDFYKRIYENGYVFRKKEIMPFCEGCNRFLPDRFTTGRCPFCDYENARGNQCENCGRLLEPSQLLEIKCAVCGGKPVFRETVQWYFDLPRLANKLLGYVEKQVHWPENAYTLTLNMIKEGLSPKSLTRDLEWGIKAPFPESDDKTIYCWMEAVLGYVSATKEWCEKNGREWIKYWKEPGAKTVFFIGKDNIPFHTIILPALLMAAEDNYVLPYQIASTEFLCYEGGKFSKSERKGVWIDEAVQLLPSDSWRFYLIRIRPETRDVNFIWEDFEEKINEELIGKFGNFVHRVLTFTNKYFDGVVPSPNGYDEEDKRILNEVRRIFEEITGTLREIRLKKAIRKVIDLSDKGNTYFQLKEPWKLVNEDREKCKTAIYVGLNICKALAIAIDPFLPETAEKMWRMLNMNGDVHTVNWFSALERIKPGREIGKPEILFRKVNRKDLLSKLMEIRGKH